MRHDMAKYGLSMRFLRIVIKKGDASFLRHRLCVRPVRHIFFSDVRHFDQTHTGGSVRPEYHAAVFELPAIAVHRLFQTSAVERDRIRGAQLFIENAVAAAENTPLPALRSRSPETARRVFVPRRDSFLPDTLCTSDHFRRKAPPSSTMPISDEKLHKSMQLFENRPVP